MSHSAGQEGVNTWARRPNLYQGTSGERWELAHYFNWIFQCAEQVSRFVLALLSEELFLSAEGKERERETSGRWRRVVRSNAGWQSKQITSSLVDRVACAGWCCRCPGGTVCRAALLSHCPTPSPGPHRPASSCLGAWRPTTATWLLCWDLIS